MKKILILAAAAAGLAGASVPANADLYALRPFVKFPQCHDGSVHARIVENFNWAERTTFHYGVSIARIEGGAEKSVVLFGPYAIPRRYCAATARLDNGRKHPVYYRIEEGMGLAGTGYKVEFCLPGYDRWRVNGGQCRSIRHWR